MMGNFCVKGSAAVDHHTTPNPTKLYSPEGLKKDEDQQGSLAGKGARTVSEDGGNDPDRSSHHVESPAAHSNNGKMMVPNVRVFTLAELKSATRDFKPENVLGEGGFGTVFKGWVDPKTYAPTKPDVGIPVAVKKSNPHSDQGLREWQAEVKFLGKFSHQNLVKLLGFCWEDGQFLLVYEHIKKGSLDKHLFRKGAEALSWEVRLRIAIGAARGLDFLHTSEKSVIYRDFKSSNILLDGDYNPKLSDFGLAKLGPVDGDSHVTTQVIGTYGYAAPEYIATGHLYLKSDVYGFGVVLLELLTGLQAQDSTRPLRQINLVEWAKPYLRDERKLKKIMDPRLVGRYSLAAAALTAQIILGCLEGDPKNRPGMDEVLATLEQVYSIADVKLKEAGPKRVGSSSGHRSRDLHRPTLQHRLGGSTGPSRI